MKKKLPIGLRLNNPLNIRPSKEKWQGQVGVYRRNKGDEFCVFESMEYGYRAAFRLIHTYITKYKLCTPRDIINRWAPPSDGNDTSAYIKRVCKDSEVDADAYLFPQEFPLISIDFVKAMAEVECGCKVDVEPIYRGFYLAFPNLKVRGMDIPDYLGILPKGGES